jgi:hypothetical protein
MLKLPIDERAQQRVAARAEWNAVRGLPLDVCDVISDDTVIGDETARSQPA